MEAPASAGPATTANTDYDDDSKLANSEILTRREVLKRRSRRLSRLVEGYRRHYWSLMEELRVKHSEFYWIYGESPFKDDHETDEGENGNMNKHDHNNKPCDEESEAGKLGLGSGYNECACSGCNSKAMALSNYCNLHILSDSKQVLYKGCKFAYKITSIGSLCCGKPILRSAIPSLCPIHLQKTQKSLIRELKKMGIPPASSTKLASNFHLMITEYVRLIQTKSRAGNIQNHAEKEKSP